MTEQIKEFKTVAAEAENHLKMYPMSICEIYIDIEDMELGKKIIAEAVGEQLIKRINFFPKMGL